MAEDPLWTKLLSTPLGQHFDPMVRTYKEALLTDSKISQFLLLPKQFMYVTDVVDSKLVYVSPGIKEVLGYEPEEFHIDLVFQSIHPDDREEVLKRSIKGFEFGINKNEVIPLKQVFTIEYRMIRKDRKVINVIRMGTILTNDKLGNAVHHCSIVTDLIHKNNNAEIIHYIQENILNNAKQVILTKRELEILKLIAEGKSSREICEALFLSFHTVNTHRKNMLKNNEVKNTTELIRLAQKNNII